jgi:hypothetical protein
VKKAQQRVERDLSPNAISISGATQFPRDHLKENAYSQRDSRQRWHRVSLIDTQKHGPEA